MSKITNSDLYQSLVKRDFDNFSEYGLLSSASLHASDPIKPVNEFRRWSASVVVTSKAVRFRRIPTYHPKPDQVARRGAIRTFSRHSRLRLRDSLANACLAASDTFGLTLTVPWQNGSVGLSGALLEYRVCFNRFTTYFRREFPFSACIFRHELQQRKMPHCHLVCFIAFQDLKKGEGLKQIQQRMFLLWLRSLNGSLHGGSLLAFSRHGVKLEHLADQDAMFRYVSDHASKSKQAQLGYQGKQWGYINRSVLSSRVKIRYEFRFQADLWFFQRHVEKCCRFFVEAPCVFGKKLSRHTHGVSVLFVRGSTVRKLIRYISKNRFAAFVSRPPSTDRKFDIITNRYDHYTARVSYRLYQSLQRLQRIGESSRPLSTL